MIAFTVVLALFDREARYILLPSKRLAVRYKLCSDRGGPTLLKHSLFSPPLRSLRPLRCIKKSNSQIK